MLAERDPPTPYGLPDGRGHLALAASPFREPDPRMSSGASQQLIYPVLFSQNFDHGVAVCTFLPCTQEIGLELLNWMIFCLMFVLTCESEKYVKRQ